MRNQTWASGFGRFGRPTMDVIKTYKKPDISKKNYVKVYIPESSEYLWLTPQNNYIDNVLILSNVKWYIN